MILGDSLSLNCICGFTESFSAGRYCRVCRATNAQCKNMTKEDPSLLRTVKNYYKDVFTKSIRNGVKERCIFNEFTDFHITRNKSIDIMHDIFEGVANYTLSKILMQLIEIDKLFSLDILNKRIQNFDYGELESTNKPRPVIKEL